MHAFMAVSSSEIKIGSLDQCLEWAYNTIGNKKATIIKIFKARPNEKVARIVFEVTKEGVTATPNGRVVNLSKLKYEAKKNGKA